MILSFLKPTFIRVWSCQWPSAIIRSFCFTFIVSTEYNIVLFEWKSAKIYSKFQKLRTKAQWLKIFIHVISNLLIQYDERMKITFCLIFMTMWVRYLQNSTVFWLSLEILFSTNKRSWLATKNMLKYQMQYLPVS